MNPTDGSTTQHHLDSIPKEPCLNCMMMFSNYALVPIEKGSELKLCASCNLTVSDKRVKQIIKLASKRQ